MNENTELKVKIPYQQEMISFLNGDYMPNMADVDLDFLFKELLAHAGIESILLSLDKNIPDLALKYEQAILSYTDKFKNNFDNIMARITTLNPKDAISIIAVPHLFMSLAAQLFPITSNYPVTNAMRWIAAATTLKSESNFGLSDREGDAVYGPVQMQAGRWNDAYQRMILSWQSVFTSPETVALLESYGLDPDVLAIKPKHGLATYEQQLPIMVACLLQNEENVYKHWSFSEGKVFYDGNSSGKPIDNLTTLMSPYRNLVGIVQPSYQTMFTAYHILPAWATKFPSPVTKMHKESLPSKDRYARDIAFSAAATSQWTSISDVLTRIKSVAKSVRLKAAMTDVVTLIESNQPVAKFFNLF